MSARAVFSIITGVVVFVVGITVIFGSWYTIDQGERGVILRNGAIIGTAQPGLGFKTPWIESVIDISVQSRAKVYDEVLTYSRDQQTAALVLSVNYRLPPDRVEQIYAEYGGEEGLVARLIDRRVYEQVKTVFGRFNAVAAIQERSRLNAEVATAIREAVDGPVLIESVQIENIDFSDIYEQSIEARMLAEVEVQKIQQNAEREKVQAEIAVIQAQAQADSNLAVADANAKAVVLQADAQAHATRVRGDAEAQAIAAKGKALRDNPDLVALVEAERWDGKLPQTMVPGGATPFISVK